MRPECSICGSKHFAREPHIFKSQVKPLHEVLRVPVVNVAVNAVVNAPKKADRHKKVRNDYFREYMKAYRAIKSGRAVALPK